MKGSFLYLGRGHGLEEYLIDGSLKQGSCGDDL